MMRGLSVALLAGASLALFAPWPPLVHGPAPAAGIVGTGLRALAVTVLVMLPGAYAAVRRYGEPRWLRPIALLASALCGAGMSAGEVARLGAARWPAELDGRVYQVTGSIVSLPRTVGRYGETPVRRFDVQVERIACADTAPACVLPSRPPGRLQLVDGASGRHYSPGDRWQWQARIRVPDGALNPGSFDRERWLLLQRIDGRASVRGAGAHRLSIDAGGPRGWLGRQRAAASRRLLDRPANDPALAQGDPQVIAALALGRGELITPPWRERLQQTGTAHLIAISGLHVGLVFGLVFASIGLLGRLRLRIGQIGQLGQLGQDEDDGPEPEPRLSPAWDSGRGWASAIRIPRLGADGAALLAATGYAALAGFGLPVQRALLMLTVLVLLSRRARVVAPGTGLALAAIGVLLVDPLAPLSSGFWLSAGAVAMLIWCGVGRAAGTPSSGASRRERWRRTLRAQLWLSALLVPVGAWAFQSVSLVSAPVNLLAIPFVGLVVVPLSLIGTALSALDVPGAELLMSLALGSVAWLRHALDAAAAVPNASVVATLPDVGSLLLCLGAIVLCGVVVTTGLRMLWWALLPVLCLPALLWAGFGQPVRGVELHVLDVGHGLAALLLTPSHTVLIDTGGGRGEGLRVRRVVMPYLHGLGRHRIDHLVLSHLDADHAAGMPWLAELFPDMSIAAPDVAAARERLPAGLDDRSRWRSCRAGQGVMLDDVAIDFLHPSAHDAGSRNDRSCVTLITAGAIRLLLGGDIEAAAERKLVRRAGGLPVQVLIAPHHGSDTSSSAAFVQAFPARDVVFAAARRSRWGFPHAAVRMRYKTTGARLHTVGRTGALVFRFDASSLRRAPDDCCAPDGARQAARRLWRQP